MPRDKISSRHNTLIKHLRELAAERAARHSHGLFVIEGRRFVEAALKAKAQLTHLLIAEELADTPELSAMVQSLPADVSLHSAPMSILAAAAQTQHPQGVVAIARMHPFDLSQLITCGRRLWLVMDGVTDPGNAGTMVRTADAAGFDGVLVGPASVDLYNPKTLRATMGSIFHIPCPVVDDLAVALALLKATGVRLIAAHLEGTLAPYAIDLAANAAIIVGNEAHGVSAEAASLADTLVKIPMIGQAESLNACTAANILMYESVRQRLS